MAVGKEVKTKINSVKSTQKITSAMEMVAASKMRRAQEQMALGLSDAGAHVGMLCDAPLPTDLLGNWVRERGVLSLEQAIRKMTSQPAQRAGLFERGILRPGMAADIVVFDAGTIMDRATFQEPHQYSEGMKWVVVNGKIVLDEGKLTRARPGRGLRGPGWIGE